MTQSVMVELTVNGTKVKHRVAPSSMLADFLHETLNLTGTKVCCGMGICKACTFAYRDGEGRELKKAQACITPVTSMQGCEVQTVEGLSKDGKLSPLQEAFLEHFSFQCGYSTPGFLMGATVLMEQLKAKPIPVSELENAIRNAVGDNICRCTGYVRYWNAIREVVKKTPGLLVG